MTAPIEPHPESYCHRCLGPNVVWCTPSPLWNEVIRGGSINGDELHDGIVCPMCFVLMAQDQGVVGRSGAWELTATDVRVELETVTPSGRVWNPDTWLWEAP